MHEQWAPDDACLENVRRRQHRPCSLSLWQSWRLVAFSFDDLDWQSNNRRWKSLQLGCRDHRQEEQPVALLRKQHRHLEMSRGREMGVHTDEKSDLSARAQLLHAQLVQWQR